MRKYNQIEELQDYIEFLLKNKDVVIIPYKEKNLLLFRKVFPYSPHYPNQKYKAKDQ